MLFSCCAVAQAQGGNQALGIPLYNSSWINFMAGDRVPVSLANYRGARYFSASHSMLRLVQMAEGESKLLRPPAAVKVWNPTGLAFHPLLQRLYVANYSGRDVLVLRIDDQENLHLAQRLTHPNLKAPAGVAVSRDGSRIAVADYGGNAVFLFGADGSCLWTQELPLAHGICFAHDEASLIATCLFSREIVRFSLGGQEMQRCGKQGWWKNEYLWPTGISRISKQRYLVADAHTGQLSVLDNDLNEIKSVGGNGPGMGLFNMPYHAIEAPSGDLIVADTYKNRIVQIDWIHGEVINALYCNGSNSLRSAGRYNRKTYAPIGKGYVSYDNHGQEIHLGRFVSQFSNGVWRPGYNAMSSNAMSSNGRRVSMEGPRAIVGFGDLYFVQAAPVKVGDHTCLVVGSPQRSRWLVMMDGVFATVPLQNNLWISGDQLVGDFGVYPLQRIAQHGMVKIRNYQYSTLTDPYERIGKMLFADIPYSKFKECFPQFLTSGPGKQLQNELLLGKPNFEAYYATMGSQSNVPLLEFCFVNALRDAWH